MKYTIERVMNHFGLFWAIYDDSDKIIFYNRDITKVLKVLKELRGE